MKPALKLVIDNTGKIELKKKILVWGLIASLFASEIILFFIIGRK